MLAVMGKFRLTLSASFRYVPQHLVGVLQAHESPGLVLVAVLVRVVYGRHGLALAAQIVLYAPLATMLVCDHADHVLKQGHVAVLGSEEHAVGLLIEQILAEAEHVLYGLAKVLTEEAEERKIARQVDAGEAIDERVVDEESLVEEKRGLVGEQDVRDGQWHLTHEKHDYDDQQHDSYLSIGVHHCAQLLFPAKIINKKNI